MSDKKTKYEKSLSVEQNKLRDYLTKHDIQWEGTTEYFGEARFGKQIFNEYTTTTWTTDELIWKFVKFHEFHNEGETTGLYVSRKDYKPDFRVYLGDMNADRALVFATA